MMENKDGGEQSAGQELNLSGRKVRLSMDPHRSSLHDASALLVREELETEEKTDSHGESQMDRVEDNPVDAEANDQDIFDFEMEEGIEGGNKWLAVARFYSGQNYSVNALFMEMSRAWGLKETLHARNLGDNRFVLEFDSQQTFNYVMNGGPWRHKGDALIVVPYDGMTRPSDLKIEKINLWIQIYDVPEALMTTGFARSCGAQIGEVLTVGGAVRDFLRVRAAFPLDKALKTQIKVRIKGKGVLAFPVKYENVPFFCFICGRIGHSQRACPDDDLTVHGHAFGPELRASPVKRSEVKEIKIPANQLLMKRPLNYSGDQAKKVMSAACSSKMLSDTSAKKHDASDSKGSTSVSFDNEVVSQDDLALENASTMPGEVQDVLRSGVQDLQVQVGINTMQNKDSWHQGKEIEAMSIDYDSANVSLVESKVIALVREGTKQKMLAGGGMDVPMQAIAVKSDREQSISEEENAAKRSKVDCKTADMSPNLVGAHEEPHQGQ